MLIYIMKKLFSFLILLLILSLVSVSIVYFSPNNPLKHLTFDQAYYNFYYQLFNHQLSPSPLWEENGLAIFQHIILPTIELGILAILCAIIVGFPIGIMAGLSNNNKFTQILHLLCWLLYASPLTWIAILIIWLSTINWHFVQNFDYATTINNSSLMTIFSASNDHKIAMLMEHFGSLLLPVLILMIQPCITTIQIVSERVKITANTNYIKVANIRENSSRKVLFRHLLPNAIPEIIPQLTYNITTLLFSTMVIEILLNRAGMGSWSLFGFYQHDFAIIAMTSLNCGIIISSLTLLSEILVALFYPMQTRMLHE